MEQPREFYVNLPNTYGYTWAGQIANQHMFYKKRRVDVKVIDNELLVLNYSEELIVCMVTDKDLDLGEYIYLMKNDESRARSYVDETIIFDRTNDNDKLHWVITIEAAQRNIRAYGYGKKESYFEEGGHLKTTIDIGRVGLYVLNQGEYE